MSGFRYLVNRTNVALSTTVSMLTIIPAAARHLRIVRATIVGLGTVSVAQEMLMSRVNAAGVGASTAITPRPLNQNSPAAAFTVAYGYATSDPTLLSDAWRLPFNGNGGIYNRAPASDAGFVEVVPNDKGVTFRSSLGTGNATLEVEVEEL